MNAMEAWRARAMVTKVLEHCDHCKTLREGVERREHSNYWPSWKVSIKSCLPCFDAAKKKAADSAYAGSVCC